jgi:hypothetical protein
LAAGNIWHSPEALAELINSVAPSVIGGAFSIAGVVGLFWLQQRAQRRAEIERKRLEAIEHLLQTLDDARRAFRDGRLTNADQMSQMLVNSWRFAWLLDRRERPVADWAWAVLFATLTSTKKMTVQQRDHELAGVIPTVMMGLNDWRTGEKKVAWFAAEVDALRDGQPQSAETSAPQR